MDPFRALVGGPNPAPLDIWPYEFVEDRSHDGWKFRMLCVTDEFTHEVLAIRVKRRLTSTDVLRTLADLTILRGPPAHVWSDCGPEFIARASSDWIAAVDTQTAYIKPDSPRENGCCKNFNSSLRDELLNEEIFYSLTEAEVLIEAWCRHYDTVRPAHRPDTGRRRPKRSPPAVAAPRHGQARQLD